MGIILLLWKVIFKYHWCQIDEPKTPWLSWKSKHCVATFPRTCMNAAGICCTASWVSHLISSYIWGAILNSSTADSIPLNWPVHNSTRVGIMFLRSKWNHFHGVDCAKFRDPTLCKAGRPRIPIAFAIFFFAAFDGASVSWWKTCRKSLCIHIGKLSTLQEMRLWLLGCLLGGQSAT